MSDFIKKVNLIFNESYRSKYEIILKNCDTKNQNEHDDFDNMIGIEKMNINEPTSVLPVIETGPAECRLITLDTEPVYEVIMKPEEAGGL